jgi:hypothetical protein
MAPMPHRPRSLLALLLPLAALASLAGCGSGTSTTPAQTSAGYVMHVNAIGDSIDATVQALKGDPSSTSSPGQARTAIVKFEAALTQAEDQISALVPPAAATGLNANLLKVITREDNEVHAIVSRATTTADAATRAKEISHFLRETSTNAEQISATIGTIDLLLHAK